MNRGRRRRNFQRTASPIRRTIQELDQHKAGLSKGVSGSELFPPIEEEKFPRAVRPKGNETSPHSEAHVVQIFRNLRKALLASPFYANNFRQKSARLQVYTYSDLILHSTENTKQQLFQDPTWLRTKVLPSVLLPGQKKDITSNATKKRRRLISSNDILENLPQEHEVRELQQDSENQQEDFFSEEEQESELEEEEDDYALGEVFDDDEEYEAAEQSDSEPVL